MLQKQANLIKLLTEMKVKREKILNYESVLSYAPKTSKFNKAFNWNESEKRKNTKLWICPFICSKNKQI